MNTNWRGLYTRALYNTILHSSCLIWQKMWFWLSIAANQAISKPCDLEQQWLLWLNDSLGLGRTWLACSVPRGIRLVVSWNHGGGQLGWAGRSFTQQVFSFPHGLPHRMCCLFIQSFTLSLFIAWHLAPLESTNTIMTLPWKPTQHHFSDSGEEKEMPPLDGRKDKVSLQKSCKVGDRGIDIFGNSLLLDALMMFHSWSYREAYFNALLLSRQRSDYTVRVEFPINLNVHFKYLNWNKLKNEKQCLEQVWGLPEAVQRQWAWLRQEPLPDLPTMGSWILITVTGRHPTDPFLSLYSTTWRFYFFHLEYHKQYF